MLFKKDLAWLDANHLSNPILKIEKLRLYLKDNQSGEYLSEAEKILHDLIRQMHSRRDDLLQMISKEYDNTHIDVAILEVFASENPAEDKKVTCYL